MSRPREQPYPWVDPSQCVHPQPVVLLKFRDSDETLFRCMSCGKTLTASDLRDMRRRTNETAVRITGKIGVSEDPALIDHDKLT